MDVVEFEHKFIGPNGEKSICHIRTIFEKQRPVVVVCSELPINEGVMVTKAAMQLYREITEELHHRKILSEKEKICFWIEHLPENEVRNESFDLVTFLPWPDGRLDISRRPGDLQAVADITGYPFEIFKVTLDSGGPAEVAVK